MTYKFAALIQKWIYVNSENFANDHWVTGSFPLWNDAYE